MSRLSRDSHESVRVNLSEELDSLFAERLRQYEETKKKRTEERVALKARRDAGLAARHAAKLRRAA